MNRALDNVLQTVHSRANTGLVYFRGLRLPYFSIVLLIFFFFQLLPLNCGIAAADTILLQPILSWTSSFVVPMALMSRLTTQPIHLCFRLPRFLLPGGTISRVCLVVILMFCDYLKNQEGVFTDMPCYSKLLTTS